MNDETNKGDLLSLGKEVSTKYCRSTSVHGLKYISDEPHWPQRLLWFLACLASAVLAAFMIAQVILHFMQSPTLLTYDTSTRPVWDVPFPALTVCNWQVAVKEKFDAVLAKGHSETATESEKAKAATANLLCETSDVHDDETFLELEMLSGKIDIIQFVSDMAQNCSSLLLYCELAEIEMECEELFRPVLTDLGSCCSFNLLPDVGVKDNKVPYKWSAEKGYGTADDIENEIPRRVQASGTQYGLKVLLDMQSNLMTCPVMSSMAFKVDIRSPASTPTLVHHGFVIAPGTETYISMGLSVTNADDSVKKFSSKERHCYFESEKKLSHFAHYNEANCLEECLSNYTLAECKCLPHFAPNRGVSICPHHSPRSCVTRVRRELRRRAYDSDSNGANGCGCLPACAEIKYEPHTTTAPLSAAHVVDIYGHEKVGGFDEDYVQSNLALVNMFFEEDNFVQVKRTELYGILALFSNIGGLLGLCMGVSAISFIEVIYFCIVKLCFRC